MEPVYVLIFTDDTEMLFPNFISLLRHIRDSYTPWKYAVLPQGNMYPHHVANHYS